MIIMIKEKNLVGLSRDYIIHPGETLAEVIEDREMTQRELAVRTGMTEKHISTVIHGQKSISAAFARKLEYALGIETSFWMNLQANYDREILEFEELNNITEQELRVLKNLKEVSEVWISFGWLDREASPAAMVLDYRMIFGISNLLDIPKIPYAAAYRAQSKNASVDPYVLFAWQRMCELLTKNIEIADEVDAEKLRSKIPEIKQVMFMRANQIQKKFADIFWFTPFHEIAHILNGDTKHEFIDFDSVSGDMEAKADSMAGEFLINPEEYKAFVSDEGYKRSSDIERFAASQNVKDYIVRGRLMKEKIIPWSARPRYEWA